MKRILSSILLVLCSASLAFSAEVKNLSMGTVGDEIVLTYDLVGRLGEREADVTVVLTIGNERYGADRLSLKGDFGKKVAMGRGKRIAWEVLKDFPAGFEGQVSWEVSAAGKDDVAGKNFTDAATGMEFASVKGGCFEMGDTFGVFLGGSDEKPVHSVCVGDFHMGKYEVTQAQWEKVMGSNPSHFRKGGSYPVEDVSWNDAQEFIGKLNRMTGKSYRLPTEAEWEYAARSGGKREKWAGTSSEADLADYVWYAKNAGDSTHPAGEKKPNGLGLYDMSGNVWEWCGDWYGKDYYASSPRDNPTGPSSGESRVYRGGSWYNIPRHVRATHRYCSSPNFRSTDLCFRLVLPAR